MFPCPFAANRRRREGERGAAAVETAIVILLLIMITFSVMEYGWLFMHMHRVNNAAQAGVREAVLPDTNEELVKAAVASALGREPEEFEGNPVVEYRAGGEWTEDWAEARAGDSLRVRVTVTHGSLTGLDWFPTPNELSATKMMMKEGPG